MEHSFLELRSLWCRFGEGVLGSNTRANDVPTCAWKAAGVGDITAPSSCPMMRPKIVQGGGSESSCPIHGLAHFNENVHHHVGHGAGGLEKDGAVVRRRS